MKKAYTDIREGQMHYRYGGLKNIEPIVFLHQNTSSSSMFQNVLVRLEKTHRVIAFDLPGFGGSYDPVEQFTDISYLTDSTMEAIDSLDIKDFHVCGQHTGASMAAEMAARFPERVKSVIMIGPLQLTQEERDLYREEFKGSAAPDLEANYLTKTWEYLSMNGATATVELIHREMWEALRSWEARGWVYGCVWDHDFEGYFSRVKCPTLLMAAKDDVLYPGFERAQAARPEADAVVVKGSNFEAELDPDGVTNAIRAFLGKYGW